MIRTPLPVDRRALLVALGFGLAFFAIELAMHRPPICPCGHIALWAGNPNSPENSQQLSDWYSLSHIIHGFLFYGALWLVLPPGARRWALPCAVLIEGSWELLENSPIIIDRYRAATIAIGYSGDSILNSMSDIAMMCLGFAVARRLPVWGTVAMAVFFELLALAVIRDNLTLNVLMLTYPIEAVRVWQAGRMTMLVFIAAMLLPLPALAQDDDLPPVRYPTLAVRAVNAAGFAPKGWKVELQRSGDLDGDGLPDLAIVLHQQDPANVIASKAMCSDTIDTNPRLLVVALAERGGGYRLAAQNHSLIPRRDNPCADDWLAADGVMGGGIEIRGGTLRVKLGLFMSAGGWSMGHHDFTFRWQQGALRLIGFDVTDVQRNSGEMHTLSIDYLTRRVVTGAGRTDSKRLKQRSSALPARPLLTIDQVGDGLEFDPEGLVSKM